MEQFGHSPIHLQISFYGVALMRQRQARPWSMTAVLAGTVTGGDGNVRLTVWRLLPNGSLDTSFGGGTGAVTFMNLASPALSPSNDRANRIHIDSSGRYVV